MTAKNVKKKLPPLNWLRAFEASARHLNFTQAAAELNMTQAAISQQIKGLENQLGMALFKRLPRGLELTEAGQGFMPVVQESIERLAVATDELFGQGRNRLLNVRVNLVFFTTWLAPRLGRFRALHPEVGLRISSNIWVDEREKEADMEVRYGTGVWRGFTASRLTWDELIPVCSPQLDNGLPPPRTPEELENHTLLHVIGYKEGWGHWLNKTGHPEIDSPQSFQLDTLITALEMASLGQGIALGRTSLVARKLASGELIAPMAESVPTEEAFYLVTPDTSYHHPHAEVFRQWLLSEAEQEAGSDLPQVGDA